MNRPPTPCPPKYSTGDKIAWLTVTGYLQFTDVHPEKMKVICSRQHWYEVQCKCGVTEIMYQKQLQTRICCKSCADTNRKNRGPTMLPVVDTGIPDFSRLPAPSLVRGPDQY